MANDFKTLFITNEACETRIQEGIEKNRKGNFTVKLSGVKMGEKVRVQLKRHKFKFGANLFMLGEFPDDEKKNEVYKNKFKEIFNIATLPFYWNATEPEEGKTRYHKDAEPLYRRPAIDLCIEFCKENNIEPREHALCYTGYYPEWLIGKSFEEFKPYMERRMQEISSRYADVIPTIEITNEMIWTNCPYNYYFRDDYIEYCFKLAEKYFPNNKLAINEWSSIWHGNATSRDFYYAYIKDTISRSCRVDLIGMQYHVFCRAENYFDYTRGIYEVSQLFKLLDKYSDFGKPIEITEVTIPAFSEDAEKEEEQADIIEKLYSVWFSHPNVEKIIYWNLVDGYAHGTTPGDMNTGENYYHGGLLRFDLSEKPAYKVLNRLINQEWNTSFEAETDKNGEVSFRGFYGEYEICADGESYTVNLDEDGKEVLL